MVKLSIAVPTHQVEENYLLFARLLDSLWTQTFQDFEIVVTDNSDDDSIKNICDYYKTGIHYLRNPIKGMAQNTNEAIRRSKGKIIKILYMDDYLNHDYALEEVVDNFKGGWLVSGCTHTLTGEDTFDQHHPSYSDDIITGKNTIGSPSVLAFENKSPLFFDENMTWLLDCDYYYRLHQRYGPPTIIGDVGVVIGLGEHQLTNTMGEERKLQEYEYIKNKYVGVV